MKCNLLNLRTTALAVGLALGSVQFAPVLSGQSQSPNPNAQQDQQQQTQTFVGKIVQLKDGQLALLTDEQAGTGVYLDDQEKAKQFEGQKVKVTGVLEVAKKMVHVTDIAPA
jgi:hypothetical protein